MPSDDFFPEIHNEDFYYIHLMAGFVQNSDNTTLPLSFNDPELETTIISRMEKDIILNLPNCLSMIIHPRQKHSLYYYHTIITETLLRYANRSAILFRL